MSPIQLIDLAHMRDQQSRARHAHADVASAHPFAFLLRWLRAWR